MVIMEDLDLWVQAASQAQQVLKGARAMQVFQVHQAHLDLLVTKQREYLVLRVHLEFQVAEVKMVSQVLPALQDHLVNQGR